MKYILKRMMKIEEVKLKWSKKRLEGKKWERRKRKGAKREKGVKKRGGGIK